MISQIRNWIRGIVDERMDDRLEAGIDVGTGTTKIRNDRVQVTEAQPSIQLEGTETGAANLSVRENAGAIELYDEAAAAVASSWTLNPALENGSLATVDGGRNLLPEGAQTGLDATTLGVQYSGAVHQNLDAALFSDERDVYLEAATASSAGDEAVTVEIYDATAAAVVDSITISGGSSRSRSAELSASLTQGNDVYVRFNVTTTSATTGATFDALGARLIVQ